jgi:hypothetical protein
MSNTSCKGGSRQSPSSSSNFSLRNLNGIINIILNVFKIPEKPAESIPPPLIMLGAALRPGLSAKSIASRIISRQSEAGRVTGDETMELIRIEEITNALKTEAVVNIVVPPGVPTATVGVGNLGAPVIANGFTTGPSVGQGIIS